MANVHYLRPSDEHPNPDPPPNVSGAVAAVILLYLAFVGLVWTVVQAWRLIAWAARVL